MYPTSISYDECVDGWQLKVLSGNGWQNSGTKTLSLEYIQNIQSRESGKCINKGLNTASPINLSYTLANKTTGSKSHDISDNFYYYNYYRDADPNIATISWFYCKNALPRIGVKKEIIYPPSFFQEYEENSKYHWVLVTKGKKIIVEDKVFIKIKDYENLTSVCVKSDQFISKTLILNDLLFMIGR